MELTVPVGAKKEDFFCQNFRYGFAYHHSVAGERMNKIIQGQNGRGNDDEEGIRREERE